MVIASQIGSDTLRAVSVMYDSGRKGVYTFPINGDGTMTGAEPVYEPGSSGVQVGERPRIAFNQGTCSYLATFNRTLADSSWNLFSAAIPASSPCTYAVTVTKAGTGSGTVTSSPAGIDCGAACAAEFAVGSSVTLTAASASGSSFSGWSGACAGTVSTCTVTVGQARSVTAGFAAAPATLATGLVTPRATPTIRTLSGARSKTTFRLRYERTGRFSFYLESRAGKRVPLLRGSRVGTRVLRKTFYAPVVRNGTAGTSVTISAITKGKVAAGTRLRVILRSADGSLLGQSVIARS